MTKAIADMERALRAMVESSREENRARWALEWKQRGKRVIGILGPGEVPEEILYAADILPWRMIGTWRQTVPLAGVYRPEFTCRYCAHVLDAVLAGEMNFLDGVVATNWDDDVRHLWYTFSYLGTPPYAHLLHLPLLNSQTCCDKWLENLVGFKEDIERWRGRAITEDRLSAAVQSYDETRQLIAQLYELRKKEVPPLSGEEMLGVTLAAQLMPRDLFNHELSTLMPYLQERKAPIKRFSPRIMVSADYMDNPEYVKIVEDSGCLVAMDDLDTGSRCFFGLVKPQGDLLRAIAKRYLSRPGSPRQFEWDQQSDQVLAWSKEYRVDGLVEMALMHSFPRHFRDAFFVNRITDAGLPVLNVKREYQVSSVGQLRTRFEAFLETLEQ